MDEQFDLVVIGSGASGLAAAVTAASNGLSVALLEKSDVVGGTSAWSGGWIWAPGNPNAKRAGIHTPPTAPRTYLKTLLEDRFDATRVDAFLRAAPEMVSFFESNTALRFDAGLAIPDTYGDIAGAGTGGRSVIAQPYDGRELGPAIKLLRKPLRETTFFGMTIQAGPDLRAFMTSVRSVRSFVYVTKRVLRHFRDLTLYRRGMDLRNGSALIARLLRSALNSGVEIRTAVTVKSIIFDNDRAAGVTLDDGTKLYAARGVVLASGGFPHDTKRRKDSFPHNKDHHTLAVSTATGDGLHLAETIDAKIDMQVKQPAALCPVSSVPWPDGTTGQFPHIIERGKPGVIGVLANGKRFCNEGLGYHDYVNAMLDNTDKGAAPQSWLICDHRFLRRYGLGIVRPSPVPWRHWATRGYLKTAGNLTDLAAACGIDAEGLKETIDVWNVTAEKGNDPAFLRGTTPYMRLQGDPDQTPNPCVAPIVKPPFHAVKVTPGSFGTFAGIATDAHARAIDNAGQPIQGLYAVGADSASVFGGYYPAGGINLGPALTFGFIAGRHAAGGAT